ncbi:MAG: dTDP-N-acetylfucosamine:lipid II N-acetylfucosaminyltransferase [Flavobacteriales bacterium]|jgi:dTDP-N-acetylfucosamine:lipid II N-acetylfucosaminyltransferase
MFLHIVDDASHINLLLDRVDDMGLTVHKFCIISKHHNIRKIQQSERVEIIPPIGQDFQNLIKSLSEYKGVFIHNLCHSKAQIVINANSKVRFVWVLWGADYYRIFPELAMNLFTPKTMLANICIGKLSLGAHMLWSKLNWLTSIFGLPSRNSTKVKAAQRMNSVANNLGALSELFRQIPFPEKAIFNGIYYSIEKLIGNQSNPPIQLGPNIFIGNSASNTSNHLDLFAKLKNAIPKKCKVVVPLSSGSARYGKLIRIFGKWFFGSQFHPLIHHLKLDAYHQELFTCRVLFFNHKRAQAFGNIIFGIWAGHKVFLREENPIFHFLRKNAVHVFSINAGIDSTALNELNEDLKKSNRIAISKLFSEARIQANFQEILQYLKA